MPNKPTYQILAWTVGLSVLASLPPIAAHADGTAVPSAASPAAVELSQQQAEQIARKAFVLDDQYKLQNVSRYENSQDQSPNAPKVTWNFYWSKGDGANSSSINVTVDAYTGVIRSMNRNYTQAVSGDDSQNEISADQARKIAGDWVAKLAPDQAQNLDQGQLQNQMRPGLASPILTFRFTRLIHSVPFANDGITVAISSHGDLLNYYINWTLDDSKFPAVSSVISADAAEKQFAQLPLALQYIQQYQPYASQPVAQLVYAPVASGGAFYGGVLPVVDAASGQLLDPSGNPLPPAPQYTPLVQTSGTQVAMEPLSTREEAAAFAKKLLALDDSYSLLNSSYNAPGDAGKGKATWNLSFSQTGSSDKTNVPAVSVTLDAATGDLYNYWRNNPNPALPAAGSQITFEEAAQKAKEFVLKAIPARAAALAPAARPPQNFFAGKQPGGYIISFVALVNGIPVQNQLVSVTVDRTSGQINNFSAYPNQQPASYPDPAKTVSLPDAQAAYAKQYPLKLQYVNQPQQDPATGKMTWPNQPKLVYASAPAPMGVQLLDAVTGQFISPYNNQPFHRDIVDIKGHWAEKQLQEFADRGLIEVKDGKISPEQLMTRAKAVHFLLAALQNPYPGKMSYNAGAAAGPAGDLAAARQAGWIDQDMKNFRPDDQITRSELADFAVRILGYGKLAAKTSVFKNRFQDVPDQASYLGDVAIASALGVMNGVGEAQFAPDEMVSLAQLAVVADRVSKLQSPPLYRPLGSGNH